jgi:hypothetical protein
MYHHESLANHNDASAESTPTASAGGTAGEKRHISPCLGLHDRCQWFSNLASSRLVEGQSTSITHMALFYLGSRSHSACLVIASLKGGDL